MDDQNHSKTLSKETSSEPSFRVLYYGENGAAVPFKWESQPGTPKHDLYSDYAALPPLTPPPSYLAKCGPEPEPDTKSHRRRRLKMLVLLAALPRLIRRGSHVSPTSPYPSSSGETTSFYSKGRNPRPLMVALMDEEAEVGEERRRRWFGGRFRSLKNVFFSVAGYRRRSSSSHPVGCFA